MSRLNINKCHSCIKRREIQTLHCSKRFNFSNAYSAQDFNTKQVPKLLFVVKENKNCKNAGVRGRNIFWSAFEIRCRQKLTEIGKCDTTMWDKVFLEDILKQLLNRHPHLITSWGLINHTTHNTDITF
jgi:hypothetical protein